MTTLASQLGVSDAETGAWLTRVRTEAATIDANTITLVDCWHYYDGPRVFVATINAERVLVSFVDTVVDCDLFLATPLSATDEASFRTGTHGARTFWASRPTDTLSLLLDGADQRTFALTSALLPHIPEAWIPEADTSYFPRDPATAAAPADT